MPKPLIVIAPERVAELEKDPNVVVLQHIRLGDSIAFRLPNRAQWRKFKADLNSPVPDRSELAQEAFLLDLSVFPEREHIRRYFDARPAAVEVFAGGLALQVGFGGTAEKKESETSSSGPTGT